MCMWRILLVPNYLQGDNANIECPFCRCRFVLDSEKYPEEKGEDLDHS